MIAIRLGQQSLTGSSNLPAPIREQRNVRAYLVLLRVEFTLLRTVARRTVRSYRTLSPLPVLIFSPKGSELSHRRFSLCCTCRKLTLPRRYLAPCSMKPGLSSPPTVSLILLPKGHQRSSDYPVNSAADYTQTDLEDKPSRAYRVIILTHIGSSPTECR